MRIIWVEFSAPLLWTPCMFTLNSVADDKIQIEGCALWYHSQSIKRQRCSVLSLVLCTTLFLTSNSSQWIPSLRQYPGWNPGHWIVEQVSCSSDHSIPAISCGSVSFLQIKTPPNNNPKTRQPEPNKNNKKREETWNQNKMTFYLIFYLHAIMLYCVLNCFI